MKAAFKNSGIKVLLITIALAATPHAFAGDDCPNKMEFGITLGFSPDSYDGIIGTVTGQQYCEASLNFGYIIWRNNDYAFKYKVSLIPFAFIYGDHSTLLLRPVRSVYSVGAEPLGLQLNFRNNRRLQPFVNATGGFLYFTEQVPVTNSSQYNFTFSFGGGVEIFSRYESILLGYRFHHISNGSTAALNPGIDLQMLSLGFSFRR